MIGRGEPAFEGDRKALGDAFQRMVHASVVGTCRVEAHQRQVYAALVVAPRLTKWPHRTVLSWSGLLPAASYLAFSLGQATGGGMVLVALVIVPYAVGEILHGGRPALDGALTESVHSGTVTSRSMNSEVGPPPGSSTCEHVRSLPAAPRPVPQVRESLLRQARAGASYVFRDRLLLGLALRPAVGNIAFLAVATVLALFAHDRLGIGTFGFGLLLTAEATGGLLGAGIASFLGRRLGTGTALTCTAAAEGLAILGLAAAPNPYVAGLALAVCGAGMGATMVLGPSLRQAIVPAHLMGRVASTSRMLAMCAAPFGAFLGGWLASTYDVRTPLYTAAGLLLTMTAVTSTMTTNRRVEAALRDSSDRLVEDSRPARVPDAVTSA